VAAEKDDIVGSYSGTKMFTNMALTKLYEQGKFHLDVPAGTYLLRFRRLGCWMLERWSRKRKDSLNHQENHFLSLQKDI